MSEQDDAFDANPRVHMKHDLVTPFDLWNRSNVTNHFMSFGDIPISCFQEPHQSFLRIPLMDNLEPENKVSSLVKNNNSV